MKKNLVLCFMGLLPISSFAQHHILNGAWKPQTQDVSCWAATLSNLSWTAGNMDTISESYYFSQYPCRIPSLTRFGAIANQKYHFRRTGSDSVLTWLAIPVMLAQPNARPLVYSFYYDTNDYHFVNFTGFEELSFLPENLNRWIYVYDPWPKNRGKGYLKNYYSYQFVERSPSGIDLQGTLYQFSDTTSVLPVIINNEQKPSLFYGSASDGVSYDEILSGIREIVTSNMTSVEFNAVIGRYNEIVIVQDSPINIGVLDASSSGATFEIFISNYSGSQLIPCVANVSTASEKLCTGAIIRKMDDSYIVDLLMNIDFLNIKPVRNAFRQVAESRRNGDKNSTIQLLTDVAGNRYVKLEEDSFVDLDNFLGKGTSFVYSLKDFAWEFGHKLKLGTVPVSSRQLESRQFTIPDDWEKQKILNLNVPVRWRISEEQFYDYKKSKATQVIRSIKR